MARFVFSVGRKECLTIGFPITRGKRKFSAELFFRLEYEGETGELF
jgi:hypothetical protein